MLQLTLSRALQFAVFAMASAAFHSNRASAAGDEPAVTVVLGRIWTADHERPWAEGLAIEGDAIAAVGDRAAVQSYVDGGAPVLDAGDGLVVPGMIDAHIHLLTGGANLMSVQLRDATTPDEFTQRLADFAAKLPAGAWITGGDWDHTMWGGELPDRAWIDSVTPNNPVWINRLDGHMALANTAALVAAGVADDVADVAGGEIVRDEEGRLTGVLKDNAMVLVGRVVPEPTLPERLAMIETAQDYVAQRGVTCVHHMGEWDQLEALRVAEQRGLLKIRVYAHTPLSQWKRLAEEVEAHGRGTKWLQIGGLKGFVDGSLGSHTAAFLEPYADTGVGRGVLVNRPENLEEWTEAADKAGLQVAVHAIGDRAIRIQLDAFEHAIQQNGPRDRRFRIEHAQHIHPDDLPRYAELGVIASMQPYHAIDDGRWATRVIGAERSKLTYAFRALIDSGARVAFGSDWFVAPPTPLEGIYAAATRRTLDGKHPDGWVPEQKISVEEALRAYTVDAAYAGFQEENLGVLAPGKLADLVVLDRNLLAMPPNEINDVDVLATMIGGRMAYVDPEFQQRQGSRRSDTSLK